MDERKTVVVGAGSVGLAVGASLSLMHLARQARLRKRMPVVLTPGQEAARAVRNERAEWNKAVEAKKAAKRALKAAPQGEGK